MYLNDGIKYSSLLLRVETSPEFLFNIPIICLSNANASKKISSLSFSLHSTFYKTGSVINSTRVRILFIHPQACPGPHQIKLTFLVGRRGTIGFVFPLLPFLQVELYFFQTKVLPFEVEALSYCQLFFFLISQTFCCQTKSVLWEMHVQLLLRNLPHKPFSRVAIFLNFVGSCPFE